MPPAEVDFSEGSSQSCLNTSDFMVSDTSSFYSWEHNSFNVKPSSHLSVNTCDIIALPWKMKSLDANITYAQFSASAIA